jgi:hypothetical protein
MAIATYNDLAATVKTWCARSDSAFSAQIDTFIALHELRMYNGSDTNEGPLACDALAAPEMETLSTVTFVGGAAPMPADANTIRTLGRPGDMIGIDYMSPRQFDIFDANANGGDVVGYTVKGATIYVTPAYDGDFNILYYQTFPAISSSNQSNTILTMYPLIYFHGVMFEAFTFMQQPDLAIAQFGRYKAAVEGVNGSIRGVRYGGTPLRVKQRNMIP